MIIRTWADNLVRGGVCDVVIKQNGELERWTAKPIDESLVVLDGVIGPATPEQLLTLYEMTKAVGGCELKGNAIAKCGPALEAMRLLESRK